MIKRIFRNIVYKMLYGFRSDSKSFICEMRKRGMRIGSGTTFHNVRDIFIDPSRPWLIEIGENCNITRGVILLTHGFDWADLKGVYGDVLGSSGKVKIGNNNVFIGMNTIILKGVTIGNNVIIGAGSLVCKDIPDNCVAAGNPARVICSLQEYYKKRKRDQIVECEELVREYRIVYDTEPNDDALSEFFWLFTNQIDSLPSSYQHQMIQAGNEKQSKEMLLKNRKFYRNKEDMLKSIR